MSSSTIGAGGSARLLSVRGVAELLGCSPRHIYRLADAGRMPAPLRLGGLVRWDRASLEAWIADGCKPVRQIGANGVRS